MKTVKKDIYLKLLLNILRLLSQKFKFSGEENENFKVPYYCMQFTQ